MEQRLKNFDDKLKRSFQNDEATFKLLKEQTQKIIEGIESQRAEKEVMAQKRRKELKTLEQNIILEVTSQTGNYLESGSIISQSFEEKTGALRNDVLADRKERDATATNLLSNVSDQVSIIQGELFAEKKNREEAYDKVIKKLGLEVLRINDTLNQEKKIREESHNQLKSMLLSMRSRLTANLEVLVELTVRQRGEPESRIRTFCSNFWKKLFRR